ncbi:phosphoribosyltransferase [Amycolatopsis sp. NPDC059657]|uniref:phosphoribosyltransferase n=1 Tax=Amycolatopsis sp. NPDC059657 TaxID=3346899 RepID=UPI00366A7F7F
MRTPRRVFEQRQVWRVTPDLLATATELLTRAIAQDHRTVDHVIGIANGGTTPAHMIASALGTQAHIVHARHNRSANAIYQQATGNVHLNLDLLTHSLNGQRLQGCVLLVDDICGSGATLDRVRTEMGRLADPSAVLTTAVLCLNTGATVLPDYSIWTISDWVVFPWEQAPVDHKLLPLPTPEGVARHA